MNTEIVRRLVDLAYAEGWSDACRDHLTQRRNPEHPIGESKQSDLNSLLSLLDPNNLLGLQ